MIVADNVVRGGALVDTDTTDPNALGVQRFLAAVAADPRLDATAVQTVGSKGHDGFAVIVVRDSTPPTPCVVHLLECRRRQNEGVSGRRGGRG